MHELSIAMSIVDLAAEESARRGGVRVSAVHLRLGALAGVVKDALLSAYELACEGSPLAGSRLVVEETPVMAYCPACRGQRRVESVQLMRCSACGAVVGEVVGRRELEVTALEIVE
jgi:hydrogenase nickel incorporation protein HypA/HybF